MKAPKIFVIVGVNVERGTLKAWFFDEDEADEARRKLCTAAGDEWAFKVEDCEPPEGETVRRDWR